MLMHSRPLLQASGGRFRSVLPSDLRFVGACARESVPIPIRSNLEAMRGSYSTSVQKAELMRMFKRCGHHRGVVVFYRFCENVLHFIDMTKVDMLTVNDSIVSLALQHCTHLTRRDGCHHCGKRTGGVIGDHQPPNKVTVRALGSQLLTAAEVLAESNVLTRAAREVCYALHKESLESPGSGGVWFVYFKTLVAVIVWLCVLFV